MKKTLIVTAHIDDEVSIAGTIIKLLKKDPESVRIFSLCHGRNLLNSLERRNAACNAWCDYKIDFCSEEFYDMELENVLLRDITELITEEINEFKPDCVFTVSENDIHQDHKIVSHATKIACRPSRTNIKELYEFRIPDSEPFEKTYFDTVHDVTDVYDLKKQIALCYTSENPITVLKDEYLRTIFRKLSI